MLYKFKWKEPKKLWWNTEKVRGHRYELELDRMILFYDDGSILEIPGWSKCRVRLGLDWVLAVKKSMEKDSGQSVALDVNQDSPR